eukprot:TRINITY_DN61401_c0_g1_i1.p1 TRINITY_DN61401_c0_g1~~TRINITY_DN61401_c0_g1_i1.p1  ORF type:complete len:441 (-),score=81.35 TRINITY_DN61401_c0_g1_i1:84-1406(-)
MNFIHESVPSWRILIQLLLFVFVLVECGQAEVEHFAICDAGSTGTRLYIFAVDIEAAKAKSVFVKKTKPGLSSYAENPEAAIPSLLKLLVEGSKKLPVEIRSNTPLAIFGTAGMRLLPADKQTAIWTAVKNGLLQSAEYPFAPSNLQARTVAGDEEGLWAVLTANFLAGRMTHDLVSLGKAPPLGLMDLGGSSTQIAIPAGRAANKGEKLDVDAVVHSYLGFGMTYIREQVRKTAQGGVDAGCYMKGYPIEAKIIGTGDAKACRVIIREMLTQQSHECQTSTTAERPCLGDLAHDPSVVDTIVNGQVDFYAVAGLTYVVDFVRWWLELNPGAAGQSFLKSYPRPSLNELQEAVGSMCAGDYHLVMDRTLEKNGHHPYTAEDNAPFRCFQANYILVLLGTMYGFGRDGRSITYLLDVDGEDLEWPLGALLHQRARASSDEL